jgi:hypothetical protein
VAILNANLPLVITHAPGHMAITDLSNKDLAVGDLAPPERSSHESLDESLEEPSNDEKESSRYNIPELRPREGAIEEIILHESLDESLEEPSNDQKESSRYNLPELRPREGAIEEIILQDSRRGMAKLASTSLPPNFVTLAAQWLLERVKPGGRVLLVTGFYIMEDGGGGGGASETDGPPGAVALADALDALG